MNPTLLKAALLGALAGLLGHRAIDLWRRDKWAAGALQLAGASLLAIVALAHICEALDLLPAMRWGAGDSPGHYLDLASAVLGVASLSAGYLLQWSTTRKQHPARR